MCSRGPFFREWQRGLLKPANHRQVFQTERFAEVTLDYLQEATSSRECSTEVIKSPLSDLCVSFRPQDLLGPPVIFLSISSLCSGGGNPALGREYAPHIVLFSFASDLDSLYINDLSAGMLRRSWFRPRNLKSVIR